MAGRHTLSSALAVSFWIWASATTYADPVTAATVSGAMPLPSTAIGSTSRHDIADVFTPGDVFRTTFNTRAYDYCTRVQCDALLLTVAIVDVVEPIDFFTAKLFDRGRLLGTYTHAFSAERLPISAYTASTSIYTFQNPTVIDFTSLAEGIFDGYIDFTIHSGRASLTRIDDELQLGYTVSPSGVVAGSVVPTSREVFPAPVPEPTSLVLLATGVAGLAFRRCARRNRQFKNEA